MAGTTFRTGIRLRFEPGVDNEVRRAILEFTKWLRHHIEFPIRLPVYVKKSDRIRSIDGELVSATFFAPWDKDVEPYIRIATGDYPELVNERAKDNALASILGSLGHEICHYEQWLKDKPFNCGGASRRATSLLNKYSETREHP